MLIGMGIVVAVLVVWAAAGIRIAQEYERSVVFTLGRFSGVRGPGLFWIAVPFQQQTMVDLRVSTYALEAQDAITKDSVTLKAKAVLWYKVVDPAKSIIAVDDYESAIEETALTAVRSLLGQHDMDEMLKERDKINKVLQEFVDHTSEGWGVSIERAELKDIDLPEGMQRAMAREAEAVREKRARLIKADAEQEAAARLASAAETMSLHPAALELRRLQTIAELGSDQNTTTIIMLPSDFVTLAKAATDRLKS